MAPEAAEADSLQERAARVERLLDEVRAVTGPVAWARVELLIAELTALHGAGLQRLLEHALACADRSPLVDRLAEDPLLSGLLLLHGLHPLAADARVQRELDRLRPSLAEQGAALELVAVEERAITLRSTGVASAAQAAVVRRAATLVAEQVGVDLDRIDVLGLPAPTTGELIDPARLFRKGAP
jgi:hypothetical protein